MACESVEVTRWTCDGCGREVLWEIDPPFPWYQGSVLHHHGGGGSGADWDACSTKCIRSAVVNALEKEDEQ